MTKELTVTEMCEQIRDKMFAMLELQEQEYIKAYFKTYGKYPSFYLKKLKTKGE
jgi:hypothetical protein|tara:strand:- start:1179 stop:1340 length:162 start_codon:yes stop_codon:yes gene_type:complete